MDQSIREGRAVGTPLGIAGSGEPLSLRIVHVLEFAEDWRSKLENVWMDHSANVRQLAP